MNACNDYTDQSIGNAKKKAAFKQAFERWESFF